MTAQKWSQAWYFLIEIIIYRFLTVNCYYETCLIPTFLYESLHCVPIFEYPADKCPWKYDCSHIEERAFGNEGKCYFQGNVTENGSMLNNSTDLLSNCKVNCKCLFNEFVCAAIECPTINSRPGCYHKYEGDNCCTIGESCYPPGSTCLVNGKKIFPGMKFQHPENKCAECICEEILNRRIARPVCKKRKCIEEITNQKQVYNFCAPAFKSMNDCCPFTWACPTEGNQTSTSIKFKPTSDKCRYGEELKPIGYTFSQKNVYGHVSCQCRVPPYITCIQIFDNINV